MGWLWLFVWSASADFAFSGKVLSLSKNSLNSDYLVKMDSVEETLVVAPGADYRCLEKALKSQQPVMFTFDTKLMKIRSCKL